MDTGITGAVNTPPEQEAPRKPGRPPSVMTTSTTNLIRLQGDLKDQIKGEHEFRNTRNGTRIIAKEMADYSAMKSYLEKNYLHYFIFCPNSEKPMKAVIRQLPIDTPAEVIFSNLEDLGFNVINMRQMTATPRVLFPGRK
jgi:hypothetical protein